MFLDFAVIDTIGGSGGRGCVGFRREKYIPNGGPNGGNGGRGGDVYLIADENTDTLSDFASRKKFEADRGGFGLGKNCNGKDAEDLFLRVPPGTVVSRCVSGEGKERVFEEWGDLAAHGDTLLVSHGGRGGYGNAHFKSSTRQAPDFAELGEPGEHRTLKLDLKLVADIGIIGYPSVGKSTLISVISAAKPKIADYHFTTLVPNLGVVTVDTRSYVVCDIPGLIEGASEGKGLGHEFLRHIERCGALLHLLDLGRAMNEDGTFDADLLIADYTMIRKELEAYSPELAKKPELVALNKTDLVNHDTAAIEKALKKAGITLFTQISCATRTGIDELKVMLLREVLVQREKRNKEREEIAFESSKAVPVLRPHLESERMGAYRIEQREADIRIWGKRLQQFTVMTDFGSEGAVRRFRDVIERIGLLRALTKIRAGRDLPVFIGAVQVDMYL